MCFRDMTFCNSDCVSRGCTRNFGPDQEKAAAKWWEGCEGDAPVAFADFHTGCPDYTQPETSND